MPNIHDYSDNIQEYYKNIQEQSMKNDTNSP